MIRAAADVNTLVEATISDQGASAELVRAWERRDVALVTCEEIVAEYEDVLRRPRIQTRYAHITNATIAASASALRQHGVFVTLTAAPPAVIVEDPDDDVILACAVAGDAGYIISRDSHLRRLQSHEGIPIVTPEVFANVLRGRVSEMLPSAYAR